MHGLGDVKRSVRRTPDIQKFYALPCTHGGCVGKGRPLILTNLSAVSEKMHELYRSKKGEYGLVKLINTFMIPCCPTVNSFKINPKLSIQ